MKSYLLITGSVFGILALVQLYRIMLEGQNFWIATLFALLGGLSAWAFHLLKAVMKSG